MSELRIRRRQEKMARGKMMTNKDKLNRNWRFMKTFFWASDQEEEFLSELLKTGKVMTNYPVSANTPEEAQQTMTLNEGVETSISHTDKHAIYEVLKVKRDKDFNKLTKENIENGTN